MPLAPPVTRRFFLPALPFVSPAAARRRDGQCLSAMKRKTEGLPMPRDTADRLAIRDLVENWAALARCPVVGPFPHRLAQRRADDGDLDARHLRGIHQDERRGLGARDAIPALPRRLVDRRQRQTRHRADQDDDLPARADRGRGLRRRLHRPLLRLPRKAQRPLGPRAAPADLRDGTASTWSIPQRSFRSIRSC